MTGNLVKRISIPVNDIICNKHSSIINAFLPTPKLTRNDAKNLCNKFGENVGIAGNFETKEDFDFYFDSLKENKRFIENCGYYDNGRIRTWIPYKLNGTQLIHEDTNVPLLKGSSK